MKKVVNKQKEIEKHWKLILRLIGENPNRPGLKDTPKRIANMYKELFRGYDKKQKPKITIFNNGEDGVTCNQMVTDEGSFYSNCEHHNLPFFGEYFFAYIPSPNGKILGLSKVARIVDYYSAKLQIQERLVREVVNALWDALANEMPDGDEPLGMAFVMKGKHLCKSMRGAKKEGWMRTTELRGCFKDDIATRNEFMNFVR